MSKKTFRRQPGSDFAWQMLQPYLPKSRWLVYDCIAKHAASYGGDMTGGEITAIMLQDPDANRTNPSYHRRADELVDQGALKLGRVRRCGVSGSEECKTYALVSSPEVVVPYEAPESENPTGAKADRVAQTKLKKLRDGVEDLSLKFDGYGADAVVSSRLVAKMLRDLLNAT